MRPYQIDAVSGARLVGGEMLEWSDLAGGTSAGAAAPLLRAILRGGRPCGHVLVLGPRATDVLEIFPAAAEIDVLVRSLPDARRLSTHGQLRRGIRIFCGGLDRFEPERQYDLVISLDGPEVLLTPDSEGFGQDELLHRLAGWLAPGGTLCATVANDLGMDRLFRLQVRHILDADDMWHRGAAGFDDRPLYHRELRESLDSTGLATEVVYAVFPAAESLSVLVGRESIDDAVLRSAAAVLAARAEVSHFTARPALIEPYDLALRVFESGLCFELAPAWLVVARLPSAEPVGGEAGHVLPALFAIEDSGRMEWRALTTITRNGGEWVHQLRPVFAGTEMRERHVVRDFGRLEAVALKGRVTLEAALRQACAVGDISRVRSMVQDYATWLLDAGTWNDGDADSRFFAVPANVVVTDDGLQSFDRSWQFTAPMTDEVLLVRGLRDFARRLLRSGAEHPWSPEMSPDSLTQTLASMAGIHRSALKVDQVARAEAELAVVVGGGDAMSESLAYSLNLQGGASQFDAHAGPTRGYRETVASSLRMAESLQERTSQVEWLETTVRARDRRVGALERQVAAITKSRSFRIGRAVTWPGRAIVIGLRRSLMSLTSHA